MKRERSISSTSALGTFNAGQKAVYEERFCAISNRRASEKSGGAATFSVVARLRSRTTSSRSGDTRRFSRPHDSTRSSAHSRCRLGGNRDSPGGTCSGSIINRASRRRSAITTPTPTGKADPMQESGHRAVFVPATSSTSRSSVPAPPAASSRRNCRRPAAPSSCSNRATAHRDRVDHDEFGTFMRNKHAKQSRDAATDLSRAPGDKRGAATRADLRPPRRRQQRALHRQLLAFAS